MILGGSFGDFLFFGLKSTLPSLKKEHPVEVRYFFLKKMHRKRLFFLFIKALFRKLFLERCDDKAGKNSAKTLLESGCERTLVVIDFFLLW